MFNSALYLIEIWSIRKHSEIAFPRSVPEIATRSLVQTQQLKNTTAERTKNSCAFGAKFEKKRKFWDRSSDLLYNALVFNKTFKKFNNFSEDVGQCSNGQKKQFLLYPLPKMKHWDHKPVNKCTSITLKTQY